MVKGREELPSRDRDPWLSCQENHGCRNVIMTHRRGKRRSPGFCLSSGAEIAEDLVFRTRAKFRFITVICSRASAEHSVYVCLLCALTCRPFGLLSSNSYLFRSNYNVILNFYKMLQIMRDCCKNCRRKDKNSLYIIIISPSLILHIIISFTCLYSFITHCKNSCF